MPGRSTPRDSPNRRNPGIPAMIPFAAPNAASNSASRPDFTDNNACSRITEPRYRASIDQNPSCFIGSEDTR